MKTKSSKENQETETGRRMLKGTLLLTDIQDYTPQALGSGSGHTGRFNHFFETMVGKEVKARDGFFIERIGDAALTFFPSEENALDFALHMRRLSITRRLDMGDITCNLRTVGDFGKFAFRTDKDETPVKLDDAEGIVVFRMEKKADIHEIIFTRSLTHFLKEELMERGIRLEEAFNEVLKGFEHQTQAFFLRCPPEEEEGPPPPAGPLYDAMRKLKLSTRFIPVFGELYEPLRMESNFIDLEIDRDARTGPGASSHDPHPARRHERAMALRETDPHLHPEGEPELESEEGYRDWGQPLPVSRLYTHYPRGLIFGLPGSGKTTILHYFAFRRFNRNDEVDDPDQNSVVLFIPCRNIPAYSDWLETAAGTAGQADGKYHIHSVLDYLTDCFLAGQGIDVTAAQLRKAADRVHRAFYRGHLTLLVDALDEAPNKPVKDNMLEVFRTVTAYRVREETEEEMKNFALTFLINLFYNFYRRDINQCYFGISFTFIKLNTFLIRRHIIWFPLFICMEQVCEKKSLM